MDLDREFQFRGNRKYLQSASLFDDLIEVRGEGICTIDFKFHRKTGNQVTLTDKAPTDTDTLVAEWNDSRGKIYVVERDEPIRDSTPYDEPLLVNMFNVDGRTINIPLDVDPFTQIEALVAGFKHLLQSVYPDVSRKYVFVRIRLKHLPQSPVQIKYSRDIGAFFQGDIHESEQIFGQIFFGEW